MRISLSAILGATLVLASPQALAQENGTEAAQSALDIREWEVPWEDTRPRDPFAVSEEEVWFVGQQGHYAASLNPQTGEFDRIDLPDGTGPHNLIVGEDGAVWYAGNLTGHIGRIDPETGEIEEIPMPDPEVRDPHTLVFDADGDIWFTVQQGNDIGHLTVDTRDVQLIPVPTPRSRPYGIKVAEDGTVWAVLLGTNKLARVNPESMELTEIDIPREEARPRRIELTDDGRVWYVDWREGYLGAYDPATGDFSEWAAPSGSQSMPYGMASDAKGRLWFVETGVQPNRFVGFDPASEEYFAASDVPSGGGSVRHMHYHEPTNTIWFGADANTIGRVQLD